MTRRSLKRTALQSGAVVLLLAAMGGVWLVTNYNTGYDRTKVWTIGTDNTFPYHYIEGGIPRGMVAEVLQEAARRTGIRLEWRVYEEGPARALAAQKVELWPLLSERMRSPQVHVSNPYLRNSYVAVRLVDDPSSEVKRVAVIGYPLHLKVASDEFPRAEIVRTERRDLALSLLCKAEVNVFLTEARAMQHFALQRPEGCEGARFVTRPTNFPPTGLGLGSTPDAAPVAERLREEINHMLADGSMARFMGPWNYYYSGETDSIYQQSRAEAARNLSVALAWGLATLSAVLLGLLIRVRRAQTEAEAANAAKTHFMASVSHELRTPLNGILGVTQMLEETQLNTEQREWVKLLSGAGHSLLGMVNDLLDLERAVHDGIGLRPEWVNLRELVRDMAGVFAVTARQKGISFEVSGADTLPEKARVDAERFRQILNNLTGNAVKFTNKGSVSLRFAWEESGRTLRLAVVDTGIGIAETAQKRVFEKFFQADQSIFRRFGGTGLGLAIVKEIVTAMNGEVQFESAPGVGSTFRVAIPLELADAEVAPARPSRAANILLVEDNLVNQRVAEGLLRKSGHRVVSVCDGSAAIHAWRQEKFDMVLMDCQMPGLDGYQTTAEIRRLERNGERTPIIAVTAGMERERGQSAGMDGFINKPLDFGELNRVLETWLSR